MQLVVLPHAGGAAYQYGGLARALPAGWSVRCLELPGRGRRVNESFVTDFHSAVTDLNRQLGDLDEGPWALLGHSLGAHVGMALCRARQAAWQSLPRVFFPSGAMAPCAYEVPQLSGLPSEAFWQCVSALGGTPQAVIEDEDYRRYFETLLRHDLALLEQAAVYAQPPAQRVLPAPLPLRLTVLMGQDDDAADRVQTWQSETALPIAVEPFAGGHFYLFTAWEAVAQAVMRHAGPDDR